MFRFKYSLTLWVEHYGIAIVAWSFSISTLITTDSLNTLNGVLYYAVNVAAWFVGLLLGAIISVYLTIWMRKYTLWSGAWEHEYGECSFPIRCRKP